MNRPWLDWFGKDINVTVRVRRTIAHAVPPTVERKKIRQALGAVKVFKYTFRINALNGSQDTSIT